MTKKEIQALIDKDFGGDVNKFYEKYPTKESFRDGGKLKRKDRIKDWTDEEIKVMSNDGGIPHRWKGIQPEWDAYPVDEAVEYKRADGSVYDERVSTRRPDNWNYEVITKYDREGNPKKKTVYDQEWRNPNPLARMFGPTTSMPVYKAKYNNKHENGGKLPSFQYGKSLDTAAGVVNAAAPILTSTAPMVGDAIQGGQNKPVVGASAAEGAMKWAGTAAPIALNPATLAATGGLSALAVPVAAAAGGIGGAIQGKNKLEDWQDEQDKIAVAEKKELTNFLNTEDNAFNAKIANNANEDISVYQEYYGGTPGVTPFARNGGKMASYQYGGKADYLVDNNELITDRQGNVMQVKSNSNGSQVDDVAVTENNNGKPVAVGGGNLVPLHNAQNGGQVSDSTFIASNNDDFVDIDNDELKRIMKLG